MLILHFSPSHQGNTLLNKTSPALSTRFPYQKPQWSTAASPHLTAVSEYTTDQLWGMPGSETALEEMMCRVLGDLIQEGHVSKIADDLYCGGETPQELLRTWTRVLEQLDKCNLRLSPTKTVICPKSTVILGWIWSEGQLSASPHRVPVLSSSSPPNTVKGMRSFVGSYKVLSRVLPDCSSLIDPLESSIAGLQSQDKLTLNNCATSTEDDESHYLTSPYRHSVDSNRRFSEETWSWSHIIRFTRERYLAALWNRSSQYCRCRETFQPLHHSIWASRLHPNKQTVRTCHRQACTWRIFSKPSGYFVSDKQSADSKSQSNTLPVLQTFLLILRAETPPIVKTPSARYAPL